jgi:flavin reductase (NADH)
MVCTWLISPSRLASEPFSTDGKLCINVLNHEQEIMARHFAGMTGVTMEERFALTPPDIPGGYRWFAPG